MKSINPKFMLIGLALALSSCKNLYVQKNVFVPLLKEKGELKAEGNLGREGFAFNSAYAFSDHFSVMLNGFSAFDNSGQYKRKYNNQLEAGLGYQITFKDSLHFESFVGYSRGWFDSDFDRFSSEKTRENDMSLFFFLGPTAYLLTILNQDNYLTVNATGTYQSAFFQNTISIFSKRSSTSFTARAQYIQYNNYWEEGVFNGQKIRYYINVPPKVFFQPVLTNKINLGANLAFVGQFGYNIPMFEGPDNRDIFEWNKVFYSVGIELGLQTVKRKK